MRIPESYRLMLPEVADTLRRGGMPDGEVEAMLAGIILGSHWATDRLEPVLVDDLVKDMLAARESITIKPQARRLNG